MLEVGDIIRIDYMDGEPDYAGKEGRVERISEDPWGDTAVYGTWGGCSMYLGKDRYTILQKNS